MNSISRNITYVQSKCVPRNWSVAGMKNICRLLPSHVCRNQYLNHTLSVNSFKTKDFPSTQVKN
jgi:hypothetical protein